MPHFLRMTRQRRVILEELQRTTSHPTALEVYNEVRGKLPNISLATVYRNLVSLAEAGQIIKLASNGKEWRYDGNTDQHHHFVCQSCGRVSDLPMDYSPDLTVPEPPSGFEVMGFRLEFFGTCPRCPDLAVCEFVEDSA